MRRLLLAFAAAILFPASALPAGATAAVVKRDWTTVVTRLPSGAFVMGNPKAKVKLVEYLSLTCPHCGHFVAEAYPPLKANYIRSGLVSLEMRHAIRDRFDLTATLLARCQGAAGIFPATEALFAGQESWMADALRWEAGEGAAMTEPSPAAGLSMIAKGAGLDQIMIKRGLPAARVQACFANKPEQLAVSGMAEEAWSKRQIKGTPSFLINDVMIDGVFDWGSLEPKIKAALK